MIAPPVPKNETKRLDVLWQYEVLDTVPEKIFDDLTDLATHICEAPIALISLVDEHRQWFKSKVGLSINETCRDVSFCAHAIVTGELLVVPDASRDVRFKNNPLVTADPKIRFYAGAPLIAPGGHVLGTLCVLDKTPRTLRPEQKQALRVLAHHVMTQLELRRHSRELAQARVNGNQVRSELSEARATIAELRRALARANSRKVPARRKPTRKSRRA